MPKAGSALDGPWPLSSAKFSSFFSIPSPTSSRTKPVISAACFLGGGPDGQVGVDDEGLGFTRVISARYFFIRPSIIFSITARGLPDSRAMSIWT